MKFGLGAETRLRTQVSLSLSTEGAGGDWRPRSSLGHSQSMMVWFPLLLGIVAMSVLPGPSRADQAMPKLADQKLCADEECSRKNRGARGGG